MAVAEKGKGAVRIGTVYMPVEIVEAAVESIRAVIRKAESTGRAA